MSLLVPVILFTFLGFEVNLTLIVAPLAGLCLLAAPARLRNLFLACVAAGVAAMALAAVVFGAFQLRYGLSLLLIMTPPLYFFLGWYLCARLVDFDTLVTVFGVIATLFVLTLAIQVIVTGAQVRSYIGEQGYTVFNVDLLGLPLYGSFGVLSLACLIVLELFIIGAAYFTAIKRWVRGSLLIGLGAATFLVTGSNARSAELVLACLGVLLALTAVLGSRPVRLKAGLVLGVCVVSAAYSSARMVENSRMADTVRELFGMPVRPTVFSTIGRSGPRVGSTLQRAPIDFENLSTGRESLLADSLTEVRLSPFFGNGFASFGHVNPNAGVRSAMSGNRTTHVQYLTILWKGGLLFFLPYMAMVSAFWMRAIRGSRLDMREGVLFIGAGLVFLFTILAFSWDILLVPSAGALGFFLLGAMSESARRSP